MVLMEQMRVATPAEASQVRCINDLDLQTAPKSVIEPKKLFAKVTNHNPTRRIRAFLRATRSDGLDLIPRYARGPLAFSSAIRHRSTIPQQRKGHGRESVTVAKGVLRNEKYLAS
jgi:hypothetical protein